MLPAKPSVGRSQKDEYDHIKPGTWWRLVDDEHSLAEREAPDHGLILLLKEVRVIDDEIHTLILAEHPLWGTRGVMMLLPEFLKTFVIEPKGAELRAEEEAALMAEIQKINASIGQEPPEERLQVLIEEEREKKAREKAEEGDEPTDTSLIPQALLPSQDVISAQEELETQIIEMNARAAWIKERTGEVKMKFGLVSNFQSEKVDTALAEISDKRDQAQGNLKNVQTMRLFLGEDINVQHLVKGKSAPESEPLTFLQTMLYLDEELFLEAELLEGFDYSNMTELGAMLKNNPRFVERMMPYQRSVVITRVRRDSKPFPGEAKMTFADFMTLQAEDEANRWIQILVRDGENIWMIDADETTSKAERLFPSEREIDAIFSERKYAGNGKYETRAISAQDIEYSDKRAEHDDKALSYKRFLLMFWGLHEREGLFGPFMPKGMNWLEHSTHSDHFRFIHDEEGVLGDGKIGVHDFIKQKNANIKDGSLIAVSWNEVIDEDTAPALYEPAYKDRPYRKGKVNDDFGCTNIQIKDDTFVAFCPAMIETRKFDKNLDRIIKKQNVKVRLEYARYQSEGRSDQDYKRRLKRSLNSGILCLDDVTVDELDYYIESRINRRSYLQYLQLFAHARRVVAQRSLESEGVVRAHLQPEDAEALKFWRKSNKWAVPSKPAQLSAIREITRIQAMNISDIPALSERKDILEVRLNAKGHLVVLAPAVEAAPITAIKMPLVQAEEYKLSATNRLKLVSSNERSLSDERKIHEIILATPSPEKLADITAEKGRVLFRGLKDAPSVQLLRNLKQDGFVSQFDILREQILSPTQEMAVAHLDGLWNLSWLKKNGPVRTDAVTLPVGVAVLRKEDRDFLPYIIAIKMSPLTHFHNCGFEAQVEAWINRIYQDPKDVVAKYQNRAKKPLNGVWVSLARADETSLAKEFVTELQYGGFSDYQTKSPKVLTGADNLMVNAMAEAIEPSTFNVMTRHYSPEEQEQERIGKLNKLVETTEFFISPEIKAFCEHIIESTK